jgi:hypothetical protein
MPKIELPNQIPEDLPVPFIPSVFEHRGGKWVEIRPDGKIRSATGEYDFVTKDDTIYIVRLNRRMGGRRIGHIDLAQGRGVHYAGLIHCSGRRNRGRIRWWSNNSGHYKPSPELANQAELPMELFTPV